MVTRAPSHIGSVALCALLVVAALGCSEGPNTACLATRSIAVELTVTDSLSNLGLADSSTGLLQAGTTVDSLEHVAGSSTLLLGGSQLGTYTVTVTRPGYATWSRAGIAVAQLSICGSVIPVQLAARLQPLP
jgi:hypothetical protein